MELTTSGTIAVNNKNLSLPGIAGLSGLNGGRNGEGEEGEITNTVNTGDEIFTWTSFKGLVRRRKKLIVHRT